MIEVVLQGSATATMVIKSTIPVGFTQAMRQRYVTDHILFSPEFLQESKRLYDSLYPSRIIVGDEGERADVFAQTLRDAALNAPPVLRMGVTEAEAVKLFANTYLALRVSYLSSWIPMPS